METGLSARTGRAAAASTAADRAQMVLRAAVVLCVAFLFIPALNPARITALINRNVSLFTAGVSYGTLTGGFGKAFRKGWVTEVQMVLLLVSSLVTCLGIAAGGVGGCMTLGNHKLQRRGQLTLLAGCAAGLAGLAGIFGCYLGISGTKKPEKVVPALPAGFFLLGALLAACLVLCAVLLARGRRVLPGEKAEMEGKYQLFLMCLPFLLLAFLFGYLPLYGWRYAFFDYKAGDTLSMANFVGFKWFTYLFQNEATRKDIVTVMRNTLAMSGLGIATSWCSMAFAIFLSEIKNRPFKKFVQTFTTIPNFISWVLIFAVATAIFSTDGFVSNLMIKLGIWTQGQNLLMSGAHTWIKMLLWGMWKGLGWGAIIYIAAISGIDPQLYEAATVDGAGRFAKIWNVTVPALMPTFCVLLLMSIANVLSNGMEQYLVFENSANTGAIQVLDLYVYKLGIKQGLIPLTTVVGMLKSVISVLLLFTANKISKLTRGESII